MRMGRNCDPFSRSACVQRRTSLSSPYGRGSGTFDAAPASHPTFSPGSRPNGSQRLGVLPGGFERGKDDRPDVLPEGDDEGLLEPEAVEAGGAPCCWPNAFAVWLNPLGVLTFCARRRSESASSHSASMSRVRASV
jgi:hypothetical protein